MVNKIFMPQIKEKKFISVADLAKILGISRVAVFNRIKRGQIPAEKVGRAYVISRDAVEEILRGWNAGVLTEEKKKAINKAIEKLVREYGETLKLLGKE